MTLSELNEINNSKGRNKAVGLIMLDDVHLVQLSSINDDGVNFDAPIGSFVFDDPDYIYLKSGYNPNDWESTVFFFVINSVDGQRQSVA